MRSNDANVSPQYLRGFSLNFNLTGGAYLEYLLSKAHYLIICDPQSLFSGDRIRIVRGMARQEKELSSSLTLRNDMEGMREILL